MLIPLLQNVSMLLAMVVIFAVITSRSGGYLLRNRDGAPRLQVQIGFLTGLIAIAMILTPVRYAGMFLDARSILISLTALFFGPVPAAICMVIAGSYRAYVGGPVAYTALLTILSSGLIGLIWRHYRKPVLDRMGLVELYLFGVAVHIAMIGFVFAMPHKLMLAVFTDIAMPILLIFPLASAVIGSLLVRFLHEESMAQEIKLSEERYRLLADNVTDIILQYDLQGRLSYVSPSVRQLGHSPEALAGSPKDLLTHPDDAAALGVRFQEIARGQSCGRFDVRLRRADGGWVWMESNPAGVRDEAGRIVGVMSVLRDVAARRAAVAALRDVRTELARVARISALGAFGASLAHEINQPLAALVTNSDVAQRLLACDPPNLAMVERAVVRSARDARRASDIIARMRSLVTKGPSVATDFDLNDAIAEVLALTEGEQQRLDVTTEADLTGDAVVIHGDRIQFQQVVLNLIQNAIEAMRSTPEPERRLVVRSRIVEDGDVLVEVEDRGPGLDPAAVEEVFERLFTTKEGGTGLGLTISKSIIEAHGGRIWAAAAEPLGAVFRFQLPLAGRR